MDGDGIRGMQMSTVVSAIKGPSRDVPIKGGVIYMCGDTAGSYGNGTLTYSNKVYDGGGYLVGYRSTPRLLQTYLPPSPRLGGSPLLVS